MIDQRKATFQCALLMLPLLYAAFSNSEVFVPLAIAAGLVASIIIMVLLDLALPVDGETQKSRRLHVLDSAIAGALLFTVLFPWVWFSAWRLMSYFKA